MEKVKLWDLLPEDREWYYRQIARDISYKALSQGNVSVAKFKTSKQDCGFDMEVVNDDGSKTMVGVKASNQGKFYISSEELDALKKSNPQSNYIIHWYKYRGKNATKFTAYKYDRESGMLVDIADPSNICPIKEVFVDVDGLPGVSLECLPKSIANNFEIKMDKLFEEVDYKKTATDISYNALKQGNVCVRKLDKSSNGGFDLEVINSDGSRTIIGVKASNHGKFYISSEELDALKESSVDSDYIIHWYKFRDKKVIKFTAYKYDKELGMLVDIADPSNICPIKEVFGVTDYGTPGVSLECLPRSIANNFEIKMDKLFGEVDYKKTAMEISYNALRQSKACVAKLKDPNQGFDLEVVNGDGSKTMIGVKASDDNNFYLTCQELLAMQRFNCQIHRYRFKGNRIVSRNIYAYDKEKNVLVDIADPKSICTIEQKTMDVNGVQVIRHECTPKKKRFIKIA